MASSDKRPAWLPEPYEDARITINRALVYCESIARYPGMNNDIKALLGIAGVGAMSLLALRGSVDIPEDVMQQTEPREPEIDDVEALARVIESEASNHTLREKVAVAWVVRNRAAYHKKTIAKLVCTPTCGPQRGRPFSSARPATVQARDIAYVVLSAPQSEDPTHGAIAILEPELYEREYRQGKHRLSLDELRAKWRERDHLQSLGMVGRWELWRRE